MKNKILSVLLMSIIICTLLVVNVSASAGPSRLVDDADLLSSSEEASITARLDEISEKYEFDVVIVTQKSIGKLSPERFSDDYYDDNGYGYGSEHTGLLLLITFDSEGMLWYISTCGDAIDAFSDSDIDYIGSEIRPYLADEDFVSAFNTYIDQCDYYIDGYINGFPFAPGMNLIISLAVGFIIAFISVSVMKAKLKSVAFQKNATGYVKQGSMNVTTARDLYLYSNVTRTAKPKQTSSTHTSSSGRSHGGGGGRV